MLSRTEQSHKPIPLIISLAQTMQIYSLPTDPQKSKLKTREAKRIDTVVPIKQEFNSTEKSDERRIKVRKVEKLDIRDERHSPQCASILLKNRCINTQDNCYEKH